MNIFKVTTADFPLVMCVTSQSRSSSAISIQFAVELYTLTMLVVSVQICWVQVFCVWVWLFPTDRQSNVPIRSDAMFWPDIVCVCVCMCHISRMQITECATRPRKTNIIRGNWTVQCGFIETERSVCVRYASMNSECLKHIAQWVCVRV